MKKDRLSKPENIKKLRKELADFYEDDDFLSCECMGDLVDMSLANVDTKSLTSIRTTKHRKPEYFGRWKTRTYFLH